jgi:hypothetical protein
MGTVAYTETPQRGGSPAPVARGAVTYNLYYAKVTMSASYASGGDTVTKPTVPDNQALWALEVIEHTAGAGIDIRWNGNTTTPKLLMYDEDNTSGVAAEITGDQSAVSVFLRFIYKTG